MRDIDDVFQEIFEEAERLGDELLELAKLSGTVGVLLSLSSIDRDAATIAPIAGLITRKTSSCMSRADKIARLTFPKNDDGDYSVRLRTESDGRTVTGA